MLGKRKNTYSSGRHRILVVSVLCLFGFCLLAQVRPAKKGEQKPAKSKVYLLHSDVLKKSPLNPDPDAQILTSETAAHENAAQAENTQTAHTGIGSWFHQRTNQILAVMIAVILLLILIESLLALKDSMNQERSHRFY